MVSEHETLLHLNTIILSLRICSPEVFENLDLDACLVLKLLLVSDEFHGNVDLLLVVKGLDHLTETPFPKELDDLIPESDVVMETDLIISSIIIKPKIGLELHRRSHLLVERQTQIVDCSVVQYFLLFHFS